MYNGRLTSKTTSSSRLSWAIFCGVSACVLATGYFAVLRTSGSTSAGLTVLCGLIVVGIAAAMFHSIISPLPDSSAGGHGMGGGFDGGSVGGGDFGGGDCGG